MPTPFMHLQMAERIIDADSLDNQLRVHLQNNFPAFYLGNVAPDYQTIVDIPRENTHFYNLPPAADERAYPTMLSRYQEISDAGRLPAAQAVFVAAYCAHLMLDLRWYREVLLPYFIEVRDWGDLRHRFLVHNTLLTYLDKMAVASLPTGAAEKLAAAEPDHWLPFALDADLLRWRDMLTLQLAPGAALKTVEIYSERLMMSPAEFSSNLEEPVWMQEQLFSNVPVEKVLNMLTSAVSESVELIAEYLEVL
jgi:hypothetical protein